MFMYNIHCKSLDNVQMGYRSTFLYLQNCLPKTVVRQFDKHITFHQYIAYMICLHTGTLQMYYLNRYCQIRLCIICNYFVSLLIYTYSIINGMLLSVVIRALKIQEPYSKFSRMSINLFPQFFLCPPNNVWGIIKSDRLSVRSCVCPGTRMGVYWVALVGSLG